MATISEFITYYKYGARPNLFKVSFTGLPTGTAALTTGSSYYVKSASIPSRTQGSIPVKYLNNTINYPGDVTFTDWTVTVLNDEKFTMRAAFDNWANAIKYNDATGSTSSLTWSNAGAIVDQLGVNAEVIRTYQFYNIFPTEVGQIDLSFDTTDAMEEFSVTFAYSYWQIAAGTTPASSPGNTVK